MAYRVRFKTGIALITVLCIAFLAGVAAGIATSLTAEAVYADSKDETRTVTIYFETAEVELPILTPDPEVIVGEDTTVTAIQQEKTYLGNYKLTAYCPCSKCCGKSDGITATGTIATADRTIAVDPRKIPYGSVVEINGKQYVAEDCGGAINGNKIDIFFNSHQEALQYGVRYADVYLLSDR